jgi:hypothetical protein
MTFEDDEARGVGAGPLQRPDVGRFDEELRFDALVAERDHTNGSGIVVVIVDYQLVRNTTDPV